MDKKKGILIVAIALVLAFFVGYGIEVFNPTPNQDRIYRSFNYIHSDGNCTSQGGQWIKDRVPKFEGENESPVGWCEPPYEKLELDQSKHDRVVFIAAVLVGILALVGGLLLNKDTISTGIVSGGVLLILYGTIRYWRHANNILKFTLLGIALAILIWLAYKKLDKN